MKKIVSCLMAVIMIFSAMCVSASALTQEETAYLSENGIMVGDDKGDLRLEDAMTRAEASKVLSVAFGIDGTDGETFPDVDDSHWAKGYIASMKTSGVINGFPDGTFKPENKISYAEFIKMTVELMGKGEDAKKDGGYPMGYIKQADTLGITSSISFEQTAAAVRGNIGKMIYNALNPEKAPELSAELAPATLHVMGASQASTYGDERYPLQGWTMFLEDHFKDELTVCNHSTSGWTTKSYLTVGENPAYPDKTVWDVVKDELKSGDWILIALGINDCSLTNARRTTEEEYKENLTKFTTEAREKGANVMFVNLTIKGGDDNSEAGWEIVLPEEGAVMDDSVPMEQRWARRSKVMTETGAELNVPVLELGKHLSELYENMYQEYMAAHPDATVAEGRNYVRYYFYLYNKNINDDIANGGFGLNLPDFKDDSTHASVRGSKKWASIIVKLISETESTLAEYVTEEDALPEKDLIIMGASKEAVLPKEGQFPKQGWGPFAADNVKEQLKVKNFALSGWSTKKYLALGENPDDPEKTRWETVKDEIDEGDWLLMTFGVNDCSLTNEWRTNEEEFVENLKIFVNEAREKGANVLFMTVAIKGGDDNSEAGWEYILPEDGIPMDENVPMEQRWVRRSKVFKDLGEELGVPVLEFGKYLSTYYENMYQEYMASHPDATVVEGRNYVRYHFHLYRSNLNDTLENGGWGLELPDYKDDSTHTNIKGSREYAAIITDLISQTDLELADYMSSLKKINK